MRKLIKKICIQADLHILTGLHIGDSKENIEIGGIDNPIIRRKDNLEPYIPGSSLKGKMRSLLQLIAGYEDEKQRHSPICRLFGAADKDKNTPGNPSRLIVRDCYLKQESRQLLQYSSTTDLPFTEVKFENYISRVEGKAEHPRQQERVPAGAIFGAEFIINVFDGDSEEELISTFALAIVLLQNDYLGGSGSRGYGQVTFSNWRKGETQFKWDASNNQLVVEEQPASEFKHKYLESNLRILQAAK
ncbi:MAG: type III-A CRISPR-associated RAMP protein Csm3 [Bacteroidia bacterium]|nr:type III-A CRISPR-associated RAMP protein Csm3 [Bacteroidia bacterium]MDW8159464.1 type III-A CRISPR-associated RAMP protein Csm3 [Bacteroidia bacterium]